MTEQEWLTSEEPEDMFHGLGALQWRFDGNTATLLNGDLLWITARRIRLLRCAFIPLLMRPQYSGDRFARSTNWDVADEDPEQEDQQPAQYYWIQTSSWIAALLRRWPFAASAPGSELAFEPPKRALAQVLRDTFGNPFRPVTVAPAWLTSDVLSLARGIYEERAFDRMPILADALQDAGCTSDDVLNHCRDTNQIHVRGCWVLDLILGKG